MKGYVLNDDKRLTYCEIELSKYCTLYETLVNVEELDFILFGMNGIDESRKGVSHGYYYHLEDTFFKKLNPKTTIYTGKNNNVLNRLSKKYHFNLVTLTKEEKIIKKNAVLTAEGVISEIIQKRPYALDGSRICIIGYGHCGKIIASKLRALNAKVMIIEKDEEINELARHHFEIIDEKDLLVRQIDVVVNTAPNDALKEETIQRLSSNIYLFDISSFPYGYHHECATHLHDFILPMLPGRYGYKTAGKIIADYIIERGKHVSG